MDLSTRHSRRLRQAGFSLVELMVGLAIGLLATIVIIQVMGVFDAQRRSTTGSADAQTNGGIALYSIARDMTMAGYPLLPISESAMECTTLTVNGTLQPNPGRLTPVTITDGAVAAGVNPSDRITIRYGNSDMGGALTQIQSADITTAPPAAIAVVLSTLACKKDDTTLISLVDAVGNRKCYMSSVTENPATTSVAGPPKISKLKLQNAAGAEPLANLGCMGNWNEVTFAVNQATGNLERTNVVNGASTGTVPSVVGVVNLQAQYGISAAVTDNKITAWVNADAAPWNAPTVADRNRIKAIRIAVVARNAKMESEAVTTACSSTNSASPTGLCAWAGDAGSPAPVIDLSPGDANWARYRYRVYETIIPLRNVIWSKEALAP
jgi:type IV pilus assembly protein PilW